MLNFCRAQSDADLQSILELQASNAETAIDQDEARAQGFVTVRHSFDLLQRMNQVHQHIVAKDGDRVVAYALVMTKEFASEIEVLVPMFETINSLSHEGQNLVDTSYFVMGQVCIDKPYRGKGVFQELYTAMRDALSGEFKYVITEVAARNERSLRAHYKVGFQNIHQYTDESDEWVLLLWDWCQAH